MALVGALTIIHPLTPPPWLQHLVMDGYTPERVPAISTLATEFAVSDQWHASIPGPTEVNRMYALSATSDGASTNDKVQLAEGYPQARPLAVLVMVM